MSAAPCPAAQTGEEGDVDGDGRADVVVGVPGPLGGLGGVDVHGACSGKAVLSASSIPGASAAFGTAVSLAHLNRDRFADAVVGDPVAAGGGAVDVLLGSTTGLHPSTIRLAARTAADRFGAAVAVSSRAANDTSTDVWVGAPGRRVNGAAAAGAIDHYVISRAGVAKLVDTVTQASTVTHAAPVASAHFGSVLAANSYGLPYDTAHPKDGLLAGTPDDVVAGHLGAGSATWLFFAHGRPVSSGDRVTQNSPGVAGDAETGNHFGAAVEASSFAGDVVGAPGQDVDGATDAGMVQAFTDAYDGTAPTAGRAIDQNDRGVPGTARSGNQFGSALTWTLAEDQKELWIGAPGDSVRGRSHAGDITVRRTVQDQGDPATVTYELLHQGHGGQLGGVAEADDRVGSTLAAHGYNDKDDFMENVLIGDPGEDLGSVTDAGMIIEDELDISGGYVSQVTASAGARAGQRYGSTPAQTSSFS